MHSPIFAGLSALLLAGAAQAADPTASISTAGVGFGEYTGTTTVGQGLIHQNTLYFIDEQVGPLGKSWYLFIEPVLQKTVTATITFDSVITGVLFTQSGLDGTNATYGAGGISYGTSTYIGLEGGQDTFSVSGNTLSLSWQAANPGDHIRVFTAAVPEPTSYALMLAGLGAVGFVARRRRS